MEYAVYTHGGGEVLCGVLNAVASLVNANSGSLFTPLIRLGILIGGFGATLSALWKQSPLTLFRDWMLPFYLILNVLFIPTASVMVIDPLSKMNQKVDNIPWALGAFAGTVSIIGYTITKGVEEAFALPDNLTYQATGTLFASRLVQNSKELCITNEDIKENMREFVGQCVVYDVLLGSKYSLQDLKHTSNIWELVSTNASQVRSFVYRDLKAGNQARAKSEIIICREGVGKFNALWPREINDAATLLGRRLLGKENAQSQRIDNELVKREMLQNLPSAYGYLLKSSKTAEDTIKQQMMISALVDGIEHKSTSVGNAPNFAARRAYLQQRTTYQTLGDMAAENLPIMKSVLEALAYAAFLFVIPLALLPMGWKIISQWAGIVLWLQMWAPLYAVLNFIMNVTARAKNLNHLGITTEDGVTLANSLGLYNINADMSAMAGYLSMSIPFISYALVKGGVGSFVHLASHLSNVTQGAASRASDEAVTGNYSFGNTSLNNQHLNTVQAHQTNLLASYQGGGFKQSDGRVEQMTSASGGHMLNIASSQLPSTLSATESDTNMLTHQASVHTQAAENSQIASSQAQAEAYRSAHDWALNQSRGFSASKGLSSSENAQWSKATDTIRGITERFAEQHGLSAIQASELIASAGAGLPFGPLQISGNWSAKSMAQRSENYDHAKDITQTSDYKEALNTAISYAKDTRFSNQDETSRRFAESITSSLDQSTQYRNEASANLQKAQSFNEAASWSRQNGTSISANLNNEYMDWLPQQSINGRGSPMGRYGAVDIVSKQPEVNHLMQQRFLGERQAKLENYLSSHSVQSADDIKNIFAQQSSLISDPSHDSTMTDVKIEASSQGFGESFSLHQPKKSAVESAGGGISNIQASISALDTKIDTDRGEVQKNSATQKQHIEIEQGENVLVKPVTGVVSAFTNSVNKKQ